MTHAEAAALFPVCELFNNLGKPFGKSFALARQRATELGLTRVDEGDVTGDGDGPDGVILPGLMDVVPVPGPLARYLGDVALYYRPRRG